MLESEVNDALRNISNRTAAGGDAMPIELLKATGDEAVKVLTNMCYMYGRRRNGSQIGKINVCPDLQERRQGGMWKLPHNCLDLALKQCTLGGSAKMIRGVPDTRTTDRANSFQKRNGNERSHCQHLMDNGKTQRTPARSL